MMELIMLLTIMEIMVLSILLNILIVSLLQLVIWTCPRSEKQSGFDLVFKIQDSRALPCVSLLLEIGNSLVK